MTIASETPEVVTTAYDHVDWHSGTDSTIILYNDPRFRFPPEELVALARAHARCPGLVHRYLRCHMDAEDVARVFGLDAVGAGGSGGGSGSTTGFAAEYGVTMTEGDAGLYHEPAAGYVTVEDPSEELDYVMVGTADEVEREQRREADAEAGGKDRVRSIEELLLEDAGVEEEAAARDAGGKNNHDVRLVEQLSDFLDEEDDAITARRKKLIRDIDRSLEEDAALEPGLENVTRAIEQHFACADNEAAVPE